MKTLILYYSRTGNNRFAAQRLAEALDCEIEEIRPASGGFFSLLLGSALKFGLGNRKLARNPADFDRVILCGPIWMGQIVLPLRVFIRKYGRSLKSLTFVTVCGSDEASKDTGFGYETVFAKFRALLGEKFAGGLAIPVTLIPGSGVDATKVILTEANFTGEIAARFQAVADRLRSVN